MKALHVAPVAHTALRWLVDRLARPVVVGTLIVLCWAVVAGYHLLWGYEPQAAWTLTTLAVGFGAGLTWRDRRIKALALVSEWHDEEIGAIKLADIRTDLDQVGPITGEHPALPEPTDGEAIEPPSWLDDGEPAITERCAGCGRPANVRLSPNVALCHACERGRTLGEHDWEPSVDVDPGPVDDDAVGVDQGGSIPAARWRPNGGWPW